MKIICIAGGSGSGKSTIARLMYQKYKSNSVVLSLDDYYINEKQQIEINGYCNFDHSGAVDCKLLIHNINDLKEKGSTLVPKYSFEDRGRSIESITEQYIKDVRPSYFKYIKSQELISDIVIENNKSVSDLELCINEINCIEN